MKKTQPKARKRIIRWALKVPKGADILVKKGQVVEEGDVLMAVGRKEERLYDASLILSRYSKDSLEELGRAIKGRVVADGELLFTEGGIWSKKIYSPFAGKVVGIDEFGNIKFEIDNGEIKQIKSPVRGEVVETKGGRIVIQFGGQRFRGKALTEGRAWGRLGGTVARLGEVDYSIRNKVVICEQASVTMATKAEVVGVAGIVIREDDLKPLERLESDMPIMSLGEKEWEELRGLALGRGEGKRVWINASKGKLLVIL